MAKDPGRQFLDEQIQQQGFDFLDSYLDNFFEGPRNEPVIELLKTPGRKKNAPIRTRAATAAAAKMKAVVAVSLEENHVPVNNFHKALLEAKETEDSQTKPEFDRIPDKVAPTKIESVNELSIIAEDDESAERSRASVHMTRSSDVMGVEIEPVPDPPSVSATVDVVVPPDHDDHEERTHDDVTSSSINTFHSVPLDSPRLPEPSSDHHTAPLPHITRETEPSQEDLHAFTAPLPIVSSVSSDLAKHPHPDEILVPIRDAAPTPAPGLSRKPSLSQFTGLSAPSPLHKSMRTPREPSMGPLALAAPSGPAIGGKRTSWLVKAKEAKAFESTVKKPTPFEAGPILPSLFAGRKRKSSEMLDAGVTAAMGSVPGAETSKVKQTPRITEKDGTRVKARSAEKQQAATARTPSPLRSHSSEPDVLRPTKSSEDFTPAIIAEHDLDRFKKTVEGFGTKVRAGKSLGKSLGGNAAAALAEARAAAEARVAERNKLESGSPSTVAPEKAAQAASSSGRNSVPTAAPAPVADSAMTESERRLSVSDLVTSEDKDKGKAPAAESSQASSAAPAADNSTSTTPPNSPPRSRTTSFVAPTVPVFSKPSAPTVFSLPPPRPDSKPATALSQEFSFKLPTTNPFKLPVAMTLGVPAVFPSTSQESKLIPLSAQSSKASMFSDAVFDRQDSIPAWMPSTQDTEFSLHPSQSQQAEAQADDFDDDDESWHLDDKFAPDQMWTPFGFVSADRDDTMTWSTLPSRSTSQKGGDTGPVQPTQSFLTALSQSREDDDGGGAPPADGAAAAPAVGPYQFKFDFGNPELDEADIAMEIDVVDDEDEVKSDLEDIMVAGKSTVSLVKSKPDIPERSGSQQSMASTSSSSQSQGGFFGQASKLVSSMLGGSKKAKAEPVKSLQLAAAAAKKQQEEKEKKAARLKEMENRRQLALQRKADEEKARALEEERKFKEENEKRKRDREEHTDKRPLRSVSKKAEDDNAKKRKVTIEVEKKLEVKKPPSKDKKDQLPPRVMKPGSSTAPGTVTKSGTLPKSALRQPAPTPTMSTFQPPSLPSSSSVKTIPKTIKMVQSSSNLRAAAATAAAKGKEKATVKDDRADQLPSQVIQAQMANRVKAQMQPPPVTSESIELPDIHSEYSDSEDEDRPRTFDPPGWAQSPELRVALHQQSTMNPDDIFGPIGPLRMEDIFRTRQSRFRARTSSANWVGTDQLTAEEEREYARRMGFAR
ncbi:hypothetical protein A0H81_00766 [Grifola frondosa]|uniref:Inner centromere protein ARK-binding domain-containing protein n=1 Tax=Grifola frondosa TaxID=5627 RepID=A0A1C7MT52_GRIFR|nr:hypothetical protein A0H81_00766 [Grifola frondosa]